MEQERHLQILPRAVGSSEGTLCGPALHWQKRERKLEGWSKRLSFPWLELCDWNPTLRGKRLSKQEAPCSYTMTFKVTIYNPDFASSLTINPS